MRFSNLPKRFIVSIHAKKGEPNFGFAFFYIDSCLICGGGDCRAGLAVENHYFDGAGNGATAAFYAVGVEEAFVVAAAVVGCELHGADACAAFAFHLAAAAYEDSAVVGRQIAAARSYPRRQCAHRAERTPCAGCIDERQHDAYDGRDEYDSPEYTAHGIPVAPRKIHLDAEDCKYEAYHERAESPGAHEGRNRLVGRIF